VGGEARSPERSPKETGKTKKRRRGGVFQQKGQRKIGDQPGRARGGVR